MGKSCKQSLLPRPELSMVSTWHMEPLPMEPSHMELWWEELLPMALWSEEPYRMELWSEELLPMELWYMEPTFTEAPWCQACPPFTEPSMESMLWGTRSELRRWS